MWVIYRSWTAPTGYTVSPGLDSLLPLHQWGFPNMTSGLFERQNRQKTAKIFFHRARKHPSSTSKSVIYRAPCLEDTLCRMLKAAQTNHYDTHSLLPWISSHPQWVVDCMENTRTIMPSVLLAEQLFKVQSSIMASLLLFLEQASGGRSGCLQYVIIS